MEKHFHQWHEEHNWHREWFDFTPEWGTELLRRHICMTLMDGPEDDYERFEALLWADTEDELTDLSEFA